MKNISEVLMLTFLGSILFITSCSNSNNPNGSKEYDAFLNIVKGNTYSGTWTDEENSTSELSVIDGSNSNESETTTYTFTFSNDGKEVTLDEWEEGSPVGTLVTTHSTATMGVYLISETYLYFDYYDNNLYAAYSNELISDVDFDNDFDANMPLKQVK